MNVVLVYGYGLKNAGDMAITEGALDFLLSHDCNVKVIMRQNQKNSEYRESYEYLNQRYGDEIDIIECPFTLDREDGLIQTIKNYLDGFLQIIGVKKSLEFYESINWSNYVLFDGGNLFRCENFKDYTRLKALFYPLHLAHKLNKPFSILPQSASNINDLGKKLIEDIIKKAEHVFLREPFSYKKLNEEFSSYSNKFHLSLDMAYLTKHNFNKIISVDNNSHKTVSFTVRSQTVGDLKELDNVLRTKIEYEITESAKYLINKGYRVKLISQCLKDDEITKSVYKKLDSNTELILERNPEKLRKIYSNVDFLIGMRLHSIIMAASVGTPSYGYFMKEWGLKNPGMMSLMNLPYSFVDNDNISKEKLDDLLINGKIYSENITSKIKEYKGVLDKNLFG